MKQLLTVLLFATFSGASAQQAPKPVAVVASAVQQKAAPSPELTERQNDKIQLAIKDYQLAQMQQMQAQQLVASAKSAVEASAETAKKELGLDDTWTFDYVAMRFSKKVGAVKK